MMNTGSTENRRSVTSVGITSLALIFVMLCLLTFSVLSLVSARADMRLSQRSARRTTAYYDAENQANDILLAVISELEDCRAEAAAENSFYAQIRERLDGQNGISFTDSRILCYEVPLESEQLLHVVLELSYEPYEDGSHYRILEWRTESTHEWETDETLPLLDEDALSDMLTED